MVVQRTLPYKAKSRKRRSFAPYCRGPAIPHSAGREPVACRARRLADRLQHHPPWRRQHVLGDPERLRSSVQQYSDGRTIRVFVEKDIHRCQVAGRRLCCGLPLDRQKSVSVIDHELHLVSVRRTPNRTARAEPNDSGSAAWLSSSAHIDARAPNPAAQHLAASARHASSNPWVARSYRFAMKSSVESPMSFAICRMSTGEMSRPP